MRLSAAPLAAVCLLALAPDARAADAKKSKELYDAGFKAAMGGDVEHAIAQFKLAIGADPKNFMALFDLGGLSEDRRDPDAAVTYYEAAADARPDFAEAQNEAATLLLLHKHLPDRAIERYRAALLEKHPYLDPRFTLAHTHGQALQNLAIAYAIKGQYGLAQGIARSYLVDGELEHSGDRSVSAIIDRANEDLMKLKPTEAAERRLARVIEASFESACAAAAGGRVDEALRAAEEVLWMERITRHDPQPRAHFDEKIRSDPRLARARGDKRFAALVARYAD